MLNKPDVHPKLPAPPPLMSPAQVGALNAADRRLATKTQLKILERLGYDVAGRAWRRREVAQLFERVADATSKPGTAWLWPTRVIDHRPGGAGAERPRTAEEATQDLWQAIHRVKAGEMVEARELIDRAFRTLANLSA